MAERTQAQSPTCAPPFGYPRPPMPAFPQAPPHHQAPTANAQPHMNGVPSGFAQRPSAAQPPSFAQPSSFAGPPRFPQPPSNGFSAPPSMPPASGYPSPPSAFPPSAAPQSQLNGHSQPPPGPPRAGFAPPGPPTSFPPRPQPPSAFPPQPPSSSHQPPPPNQYQAPQRPPMTNGGYPPNGQAGPPSFGGMPPAPSAEQFARLGVSASNRPVDLLASRDVRPPRSEPPPKPALPANAVENPGALCDPDIFRCTLPVIPNTPDLLKKSRLPLGLILHPFKDLKSLTILQVSQIVRCRACRTYINPFAQLTDQRHWRCNICFRVNDLPEDFSWDPVTKSYGEPQRRPEIRHATIEFIAPGEYMPVRKNMAGRNELRPPQAACYVFVLDVSANALETGYLTAFCAQFLNSLDKIPSDSRAQMGFITVNSMVHFYQFTEGEALLPPKQLVVSDLDDMFVPSLDGLLANLSTCKESIREFVQSLPEVFERSNDVHSALGAAVKAAHELIKDIGGRVTVVQTMLPDVGPGALSSREDPNQRASDEVPNLGPATDFYKQLALECSGHQVAIDLFLLSSQYADIATLSGMAKFCGGVIHYYPSLHYLRNSIEVRRFEKDLGRYLTRKIGFESVLRIRCTKGLALHTFHGNFFVRSTDLLALPNTNPDTALGVQVQMDESLADLAVVSFQAALLYTSSRGDRRIRVHTMCLPVTASLGEIQARADPEALVSLLAKMAVERSITSGSIRDAREALVNAVVDALGAYVASLPSSQRPPLNSLPAPPGALRLLPLYVLALLKHLAFSAGLSVKLDLRVFSMCQFRTLPLRSLMLEIHPALYPLHTILDYADEDGPPELQLSAERLDRYGAYALDCGSRLYLYLCGEVADDLVSDLLDKPNLGAVDEDLAELPELDNEFSQRVRDFLHSLQLQRPFHAPLKIIREDSKWREVFMRKLVEDKSESSHSYVEFLQHVRREMGSK